tara:strand:+ start:1119 stop:1649 length:531 start_codon:yes stop_codon:yes gene_type:complete
MSLPNLKTCEYSMPVTRMFPVAYSTDTLGRGPSDQIGFYDDIIVPWGHCYEIQFIRATNEHESSTYDLDIHIRYGGWNVNGNYYASGRNGQFSTSNSINNTTPYLNGSMAAKDVTLMLCHEKEITADSYVDIITKDNPLYLSEGMGMRFENNSADYATGWTTKTLAMTVSYIDHYN